MKNILSGHFTLSRTAFYAGIILVLLFSAFIRFYQLGQIPHGMTWDEAAIGYNGYAIFTTRRDEWLQRLPVSFWSFGDYKAPLAIYFNGVFTFLFGMNLWAVRLPFTLASIFALWGMILLSQLLLEQSGIRDTGKSRFWAILTGGFLSTSPWHFHYSRAGFESGIALCFIIWGIYFWYKSWETSKLKLFPFLSSLSLLVASLYTYHSAKIVTPLLIVFLIWQQRNLLLSHIKPLLLGLGYTAFLLFPLIVDSLWGKGLVRAGTLIFSQEYTVGELFTVFFRNAIIHLSPSFLLLGETSTLRHGDGQWGVLLPTVFFACLSGLLFALRGKMKNSTTFFVFFWIGCGLLPAFLGQEVPHSNRALLALPGFILVAVLALAYVVERGTLVKQRLILGMFLLLHSIFFAAYMKHYFTVFSQTSSGDFQDGYLEAFQFVIPFEKGTQGQPKLEKIIFTSDYGQPYIYALFTRKTNPIWYQGGSLVMYEFKDDITLGDLERPHTVVVASPEDDLLQRNENPDHVIYGSDGSVRFKIYVHP